MSNLPPSGEIPRGAIRFNTDSNKPELWDGSQWAEFQLSTPNLAQTGETNIGARGLFVGGETPSRRADIDIINFASAGNSVDFGDMNTTRSAPAVFASSTRAIAAGGETPSIVNTIEFMTIASTGSATDFGAILTDARRRLSGQGCSNQTRGMILGGFDGSNQLNLVDFITIASNGTAAVDFGGDLTATTTFGGTCATPTRAVLAGGHDGGSPGNFVSTMQQVNFTTTGVNFADFGDLTQARSALGAANNATRGVWSGGQTPSSQDTIDSMIMATLGNAIDFGDLFTAVGATSSCSSPTKVATGGGAGNNVTIQYQDITSGANAEDFGDLHEGRSFLDATSNAHGGL